MSVQRNAELFVAKWASVTVNEKAMAQTHFNELCDLLDVPAPLSDPTGMTYRFEKPLTKSGGGAGFADVWRQHIFAWEYKGKGKNLEDAYRQLQLYKEDLDNPPVLVVSDIENIEIHVVFTGYPTKVHRYTNAEIAVSATRDVIRYALSEPERLRPRESTQSMTEQAAKQFAKITQMIESRGFPATQVAPFFMRILFCLFAEDIGIFPDKVLTDIIRASILQPNEFGPMMSALFDAIHRGSYFGAMQKLPRVEGTLFGDNTAIPLTADELQYLHEAAKLDWSQVEPTIFGTLFERSLDPSKRAQLGAHYTSRDDILLVVEPVLMQPLRQQWDELQTTIAPLIVALQHQSGIEKQLAQGKIESQLYQFAYDLSTKKVLDPACGSGNFLYVSLGQMLDLEKEIYTYATGFALTPPTPAVRPANFFGIEKNTFAAELARVVLTIGYVQWQYTNGFWTRNQTIEMTDTITNHDALMQHDTAGLPYRPDWPFAHVIVGNPPFLGSKKMRTELGDTYVNDLHTMYKNEVATESDLVCYWFERARVQITQQQSQRAGLIATQAIRGGANRKVLQKIIASGQIFMAWSNREWVLDGAAVRVSIVGFDGGSEKSLVLDGQLVDIIYANLTSQSDTTQATILPENLKVAFMGDTKQGAFEIEYEIAQQMLIAQHQSGLPNSDVVRPWINGMDVVRRPRNMYIIDFGVDMTEADSAQYTLPFTYVTEHVKSEREANWRDWYRPEWWLHYAPRPEMRHAVAQLPRYIVTSRVSKHRVFSFIESKCIPDSRLFVFARSDDYFFGILSSHIHEVWSLHMASRHGDGNTPTYNTSTCFETFPFPWAPGAEPVTDPRVAAIASATRVLVAARDAWLNPPDSTPAELTKRTMTNLYNTQPSWLRDAHATLDAAVCAAYGWPATLADNEIIARLLELNQQRAAHPS